MKLHAVGPLSGEQRAGVGESLNKVNSLVVLLLGAVEVFEKEQNHRQVVIVLGQFQTILPVVRVPYLQRLSQTNRLLIKLQSSLWFFAPCNVGEIVVRPS